MSHPLPTYTLEQLEAQGRIELDHFTNEDAYDLGTLAAEVTREWGVSLSVDVVIGDYLAYRARLGKTGIGNDPWLAGKAAVARHFGELVATITMSGEPDVVDHEAASEAVRRYSERHSS
jgi:uncharacterized protein (UPF0303 family)